MPVDPAGIALASLAANPAIRLFLDRARQRQPDFALTAANAVALAAICRRLDGLPLAIELAAARLGVLAIELLAERLDDLLGTLATRERGIPARQQTLRATLDRSYGLLSAEEKRLFRALAPFSGTWSFEAAEAVAPAALREAATLAILEGLIDKSLVSLVPDGAQTRYRLLEPVRQYGLAQLRDAGEVHAAHARVAAYCLALVAGASDEMIGPARGAWLVKLDREADLVRATLDWLRAQGAVADGLRLCAELWRFWSARRWYDDSRRWLATFLALADAEPAPAIDPQVLIGALIGSGMLAREQGDYPTAISVLEHALALAREHDPAQYVAGALTQLAYCFHRRGDLDTAERNHREAMELRQANGDRWGMSISLMGLGNIAPARGAHAPGNEQLLAALAIQREIGDRAQLSASLFWADLAMVQAGDFADARPLLEEGVTLGRASGAPIPYLGCLIKLGELATQEGDFAAARAPLKEALQAIQRASIWSELATCLRAFAPLAAAAGDYRRAILLDAFVVGNDAALGIVRRFDLPGDYAQSLARARTALGPTVSGALASAGARLAIADAISEAFAIVPA